MMKDLIRAMWRGTTAVNPDTGAEIGLSFDVQRGGMLRMLMSLDSARALAESVLEQISLHEARR